MTNVTNKINQIIAKLIKVRNDLQSINKVLETTTRSNSINAMKKQVTKLRQRIVKFHNRAPTRILKKTI